MKQRLDEKQRNPAILYLQNYAGRRQNIKIIGNKLEYIYKRKTNKTSHLCS
jgi:hypothetical protein